MRSAHFRSRGKPAIAWAETFGEFNPGSVGYYLATFCDEIWLQPSGDVCLTGLAIEVPFLRGALDKAGIVPQLAQRHEYKNAANMFTEREFTDAHREATQRIVESMMDQLVSWHRHQPQSRRTTDVRALVDRGAVVRRPRRSRPGSSTSSAIATTSTTPCESGSATTPSSSTSVATPDRSWEVSPSGWRGRRHRGPGARHRTDPPRAERSPASRRGDRRLGHGGRRPAFGDEGPRGQGDRPARRQPWRFVRRLRCDLAPGRSHP